MVKISKPGLWVAAGSGALAPLAFSPFGIAPLAIVSAAALLVSWMTASGAFVAAIEGFLFGLGMFGVGVSWIYISLHRFGGMDATLSVTLVMLFVAFLSLFPAIVGFLSVRFLGPTPRRIALGAPALWTLGEWLRGRLFSGFPWLSFGYSQAGHALGGIAPYGGVYAVSWVVVAIGGLIAWAVVERRVLTMVTVLAVTGLVFLGSAEAGRVAWVRPVGPQVKVALVQGDIPENIKWVPGELTRIVRRYLLLTDQAPGARIAVWPETAIPDYLSVLRPQVIPMLHRYALRRHMDLLVGLVEDRGRQLYNSVADIGPGVGMSMYRKRHLVPFGEYLPWPALFSPLLTYLHIPMSDFNSWPSAEAPLPAGNQKLGVSICYEDVFSRDVMRLVPAATVLVNVSDDGWYGRSLARYQHLEIARMRAIEAGRFMLSDTNNGITAVISEHGRVLGQLPSFVRGTLSASVQPYSGETPYVRFGDLPTVGLAALVVALLFLSKRGWRPA